MMVLFGAPSIAAAAATTTEHTPITIPAHVQSTITTMASPLPDELAQNPYLDDMLQVRELLSLRMTAEAVVCSACQTALGRLHSGEGLIRFTRALFIVGARCVIASLCPVDDQPTAALMFTLYQRILEGYSIAEALRLARVETRQRWSDSCDWAGFVVIGLGW